MMSGAVAAAVYAASPLRAIWDLHTAIKSGDTARVAARVDWPRVQATLRQSIALQARLVPTAQSEAGSARPTGRVSLWDRLKAHFGGRLLDRFIARYITPQGLIDLDRANRRGKVTVVRAGFTGRALQPSHDDATAAAPSSTWAKGRQFLNRVRSAGFCSLTCFVVRIADKRVATRSYLSQFELVGSTWKMTRVEVQGDDRPAPTVAQSG